MSTLNSEHNRVVWVDIPVADLARASAFYAGVTGINVQSHEFGSFKFSVLDHEEGNGASLVIKPNEVSPDRGILVYINVNGRIRNAVARTEELGGTVLEPIHSIDPFGFRSIVLDSEGNRIALHSEKDE